MQVGHQMRQVFPPKIFDGMRVVAFGRQVQQDNRIGASIVADRLYGRHTLLVGEVAVAARDAVDQKCRTPGRGQQLGAVVGFNGQNVCPFGEIQKRFGHAAQVGGQREFQVPVFHHERAAHVLVVRYANGVKFGFSREIQNAFVEAHEAAMNPDLARFFLLAAFQNGGHLVGGKCFGNVEMDMITIEMGREETGQITPPKIEFRQTVRQAPWGDPGIEQIAVNAAIGAVEF